MECVVLLSGGVDSTTCLAMAVEKYGKENVLALTAYYGQKHAKELEAARKVAAFYGVAHQETNLSQAFALSDCPLLQGSTQQIEHESYAKQLAEIGGQGTIATYVPFRNGLFLSYAAAIAISVGASVIYYGAHADFILIGLPQRGQYGIRPVGTVSFISPSSGFSSSPSFIWNP